MWRLKRELERKDTPTECNTSHQQKQIWRQQRETEKSESESYLDAVK